MNRIGVVAIVVVGSRDISVSIQNILSEYGDIIAGRMGVPFKNKGISTIALIVDGTTERISALTGKLGRLSGVTVKSTLTNLEIE